MASRSSHPHAKSSIKSNRNIATLPPGMLFAELRTQLGLPRKTFARLMAVSERSLASIETGSKPSEPVRRRGTEIRRVIDGLAEVIAPEAIGAWLQEPNDAFDGLKPLEVIERGEIDRIWRMIFLVRSGVAF